MGTLTVTHFHPVHGPVAFVRFEMDHSVCHVAVNGSRSNVAVVETADLQATR